MRFAEIGKHAQEQRSPEYWKSLEAKLSDAVKEKILRTMVPLQQRVDQANRKQRG